MTKWEKVNIQLSNICGVIVKRNNEQILTAEYQNGKYRNIEFTMPEYQKCNKTRQKAIAVLTA